MAGRELLVRILGDATGAEKSLESVSKKTEGAGASFAKFGAGVGVVGVAVVGFAVAMADKFEGSHARLTAAIEATGGTFNQYKSQIGAVQNKLEGYGFTNAQVQDALSHSVVSTQNVGKSLGIMGLAADLAKMKNIDLTTATDTLDKAMTGNLRPLKALAIDLPIAATNALKLQHAQDAVAKAQEAVSAILAKSPDAVNANSKAHAAYEKALTTVVDKQKALTLAQGAAGGILDALTQRLHGQASTAAETFGGKMLALRTKVEDLGKNLGLVLIPILDKLMSTVMDVVKWLQKHQDVLIALGIAVGAVVVPAFLLWIGAALGAAAANVAAVAPVLAVIAVIALLAAGVMYAYNHWKAFHVAVDAVAAFLRDVAWPKIKEFYEDFKRGIEVLRQWWDEHWTTIKATLTAAVDIIKGYLKLAWDEISGVFKIFSDLFSGKWSKLWGDVTSLLKNVQKDSRAILKAGWDALVGLIETFGPTILKAAQDAFFAFINWAGVELPSKMRQIGIDIVKAIIDGIGSMAGSVGKAIGGIVKGLPGGSAIAGVLGFAEGGLVPGRLGAPMLAVVHGGETVMPPGRPGYGMTGGATYNLTVNANYADDATIMSAFRRMELLHGRT